MASSLPENWALTNGSDEFNKFEVPEIDGALLISLLEESQAEDCEDHEGLTNVIRSLEAEIIDPNTMDGHGSPVHSGWPSKLEGCQPLDAAQVDGQDWSTLHDLEFNWMDVDVDVVDMAPYSPNDDMANWYMDPCGEMLGLIEFGGARDYSQIYYGVPLEDHTYGSLWQETNNSMMYG